MLINSQGATPLWGKGEERRHKQQLAATGEHGRRKMVSGVVSLPPRKLTTQTRRSFNLLAGKIIENEERRR